MPDYTIYNVTLSLLTPLHIGNGRELLHEYDYAIYKGRTWRLDENAWLEAQAVEDPEHLDLLMRTPPAQLLKPADFRPETGFFRYVLEGTPRSAAEGAQLREQIKDPFDRPYLPGSSLKGALRTAVAWHAWGERRLQPEIRRIGRSRQWAAQDYERELMGRNPNHDLMRALQVGDSETVEPDRLMIVNARVLNRGGGLAAPIEMEALRPDTSLHLTVKLDRVLFSEWARRGGLQLEGGPWLTNLAAVVQARSRDHAAREAKWFGQIEGAGRVAGFYQKLAQANLGPGRFLVQLGWGTGWEDKTFGTRLSVAPDFMERLINDHRLARGHRRPNDPFPKSRRVAVAFNGNDETPATPFGWAIVEMKPK